MSITTPHSECLPEKTHVSRCRFAAELRGGQSRLRRRATRQRSSLHPPTPIGSPLEPPRHGGRRLRPRRSGDDVCRLPRSAGGTTDRVPQIRLRRSRPSNKRPRASTAACCNRFLLGAPRSSFRRHRRWMPRPRRQAVPGITGQPPKWRCLSGAVNVARLGVPDVPAIRRVTWGSAIQGVRHVSSSASTMLLDTVREITSAEMNTAGRELRVTPRARTTVSVDRAV